MKKGLFLLGQMHDGDMHWLMNHGTQVAIHAGEILINKNIPVTQLYIVLSGRLIIKPHINEGLEIAVIGVGEVVGEMSLVESRLPSVNVVASEDSELYAIPISLLKRKMGKNTTFRANIYHSLAVFLSDRLRKTTSQLACSNHGDEDLMDDAVLDKVSHLENDLDELLTCRKKNGLN